MAKDDLNKNMALPTSDNETDEDQDHEEELQEQPDKR